MPRETFTDKYKKQKNPHRYGLSTARVYIQEVTTCLHRQTIMLTSYIKPRSIQTKGQRSDVADYEPRITRQDSGEGRRTLATRV